MSNSKKVVVALGGNALEEKGLPPTAESQLKVVERTSEYLSKLYLAGYEMFIVHGNGPQVGRILISTEASSSITPSLPFDVCGAMSQGYIGYHIQQALSRSLMKHGKNIPVSTIITQVVVDKNDPAFSKPTKPIGPFYTEEEAVALQLKKGYTVIEDAGRGWRRVVASPKPCRIVEIDAIKNLSNKSITISCGGGGIPVVEDENGYLSGVAAVIDKDMAAEKLAKEVNADILLILTQVPAVYINFNTPNQLELKNVKADEIDKYLKEGHFKEGSMLPKVIAALDFVKSGKDKKAIITSLDLCLEALEGKCGTLIT